MKDSVSKLCENLKNPYFNIFHWCKGEVFDIDAINQALALKDKIFEKIGKNEKITQVFDHSCNINVRLDFIEFINPYLFTKK